MLRNILGPSQNSFSKLFHNTRHSQNLAYCSIPSDSLLSHKLSSAVLLDAGCAGLADLITLNTHHLSIQCKEHEARTNLKFNFGHVFRTKFTRCKRFLTIQPLRGNWPGRADKMIQTSWKLDPTFHPFLNLPSSIVLIAAWENNYRLKTNSLPNIFSARLLVSSWLFS